MYQRILVPVDGSDTSQRGLDEAIALARLTGGSLRLVHVVDELSFASGFETYTAYAGDVVTLLRQAGEQILERAKARAAAAGVTAQTQLFESYGSRLSDLVADQARDWRAELVVIGTHGRRGVGRWLLGSDAEQIVRTSTLPVLLVRALPAEAGRSAGAPGTAAAAA
jgi:nucleotide-binding universal stress UspA family protein